MRRHGRLLNRCAALNIGGCNRNGAEIKQARGVNAASIFVAIVAGLDAGFGYNTWPLIDGAVVPKGLFAAEPWWRNMFENALTVQFNHRNLAYVIAVLAVAQAYVVRSSGSLMLLAAVLAQVALGVWTLLWAVPLWLGLAHQGGALVVLAAAIWNLHCELKGERVAALRTVRAS